MRLVGRFGLVCAKFTAAGLLLTGAAACAGVAAAPATVPHGGATPARTAPAGGTLDGPPAFVTAGTAVDGTRPATAGSSSPTSSSGSTTSGGATLKAGNPDGHA